MSEVNKDAWERIVDKLGSPKKRRTYDNGPDHWVFGDPVRGTILVAFAGSPNVEVCAYMGEAEVTIEKPFGSRDAGRDMGAELLLIAVRVAEEVAEMA